MSMCLRRPAALWPHLRRGQGSHPSHGSTWTGPTPLEKPMGFPRLQPQWTHAFQHLPSRLEKCSRHPAHLCHSHTAG